MTLAGKNNVKGTFAYYIAKVAGSFGRAEMEMACNRPLEVSMCLISYLSVFCCREKEFFCARTRTRIRSAWLQRIAWRV